MAIFCVPKKAVHQNFLFWLTQASTVVCQLFSLPEAIYALLLMLGYK